MIKLVRNIVNIRTIMYKKEPNKSKNQNQTVHCSSLRIISWTFSTHFSLCDLEYKSDDSLTLINRRELKFKHTETIEIKAPPARIQGMFYRVVIFQAVCLSMYIAQWGQNISEVAFCNSSVSVFPICIFIHCSYIPSPLLPS